jgi:hypothetical protein
MYHSKLYSFFLGSLLLLSWFVVASIYSAIKYAYSNTSIQKSIHIEPRPLIVPNLDEYRIDYIIDTNQYQEVQMESVKFTINYEESLKTEVGLSNNYENDDMVIKLRDIAQTAKELCKELNGEMSACYEHE